MKTLLLPLVLIAGGAVACPGASSKDAAAPADAKAVVAQKAAPKAKVAAVKSTKVAEKGAPGARRSAS